MKKSLLFLFGCCVAVNLMAHSEAVICPPPENYTDQKWHLPIGGNWTWNGGWNPIHVSPMPPVPETWNYMQMYWGETVDNIHYATLSCEYITNPASTSNANYGYQYTGQKLSSQCTSVTLGEGSTAQTLAPGSGSPLFCSGTPEKCPAKCNS